MRQILLLAAAGIALILFGVAFNGETAWTPPEANRPAAESAAISPAVQTEQLVVESWAWNTLPTDSTGTQARARREGARFLRN